MDNVVIFYAHLKYFTTIWYIFIVIWYFCIFSPVFGKLGVKKNLATLVHSKADFEPFQSFQDVVALSPTQSTKASLL
jgi:hypothetical protein